MYKGLEETSKLKYNQLVLTRCPNWCDEGYSIATWDGEEFVNSAAPNNLFNGCVIAFIPLDEDGEPCALGK